MSIKLTPGASCVVAKLKNSHAYFIAQGLTWERALDRVIFENGGLPVPLIFYALGTATDDDITQLIDLGWMTRK